ncbi:MAG TPA: DUF5522 domain-containing protein [Pyrinomonadaceae bacterium]|nr:DUF5522 domain-containing protein [Pyrinomonadaceae bacterium]
MTNSEQNKNKESSQNAFIEGIDYYFENGLMVLTEHFLLKRGYCCSNDCRHCPYKDDKSQQKSF